MSRIGNMIKQAQNNILKNYEVTLNSSLLLYVIVLLTIGDLIYLSLENDMMSFFIYLTVGYLTSFFSKNMIVILVIAMVVTHILRFNKIGAYEGMSNKGGDNPIADFEKMKADYNLDDLMKENFVNSEDRTKLETAPANIDSSPAAALSLTDVNSSDIANVIATALSKNTNVSAPMASVSAPMASVSAPMASVSAPMASVANANNKLKDSTNEIKKIRTNLLNKYTPTIAAFANAPISSNNGSDNNNNNINLAVANLLGGISNNSNGITIPGTPIISGFENLNAQTQKLLNTQTELMSNMENLSPLLAQAEKFMEKFQGLSK